MKDQKRMDALLAVDDLCIDFSTSAGPLHAVRGVSFGLGKGEILGIVGESGSGKSVTAHTLLRLLPGNGTVQRGSILYRGEPVFGFSKDQLQAYRGAEVSIIFQEPGLSFDPIYPIGKAMEETLKAHNPALSDEEARQKSLRLLEEVNVPQPKERLGNFPHQFSGGLLQRIMIALALASDPKILIADEPTTALDVTIQAQIIDLLLKLNRERNLAVLFITHNLALVSGIADRIMVMYAGLVMENGPAERVLTEPRHPYTRALLDSILTLGDHHGGNSLAVIPGMVPNPLRPEPGCPFEPRCRFRQSACSGAVPPLTEAVPGDAAGSVYRCIVPGVKLND